MISLVAQAQTQEELCEIYILRYAIYIEEMGFPFPKADNEKRMLYDEYDKSAIHFYIRDCKEEVIGIYRTNVLDWDNIPPELEERYAISTFRHLGITPAYSSKMMIKKDCRGLSCVNQLLRKVFEHGVKNGLLLNFIDCSEEIVSFYERIGYRRYYKNFIDPILGEKVPMVLIVSDLEHLEKINSPLYKVCLEHGVVPTHYGKLLNTVFNSNAETANVVK
jgi:predicted GNAT family N-acyltransferase